MLSKIEELRVTAKYTNTADIGICKWKLGALVLGHEISVSNYKILCYGRNRHGGGVACYVRNG